MRSPGINGEGELSGQPANPGSPGKMAVKNGVCVCVCVCADMSCYELAVFSSIIMSRCKVYCIQILTVHLCLHFLYMRV